MSWTVTSSGKIGDRFREEVRRFAETNGIPVLDLEHTGSVALG
jgi:hypothetical protein